MFITSIGLSQVTFENLSLEAAMEKAEKEDKKIFIDVYTTWCGPCKRMDAEVFSDKMVGERMSKEYIALKIDYERSPFRIDISKYRIKGYPTLLFLDAKGIEIGRIFGARRLDAFNMELDRYSGKKHHPVSQAILDLRNNPDDQDTWKTALDVLNNNINIVYQYSFDKDYLEACQNYYKKFDIKTLEDDVDLGIFRKVELPLEHPVVQQYLSDSLDYGTYLHKKYMTMAFKDEVKNATNVDELKAIKVRADRYYDHLFEHLYGDVEPREYFMEDIFNKN